MVKRERTPLQPSPATPPQPSPVWGGSFGLVLAIVASLRKVRWFHGGFSRSTRNFLRVGWSLLLLTACSGAEVATLRPVLITIGGATAMQPVLQALTSEYSRRYPNVLFTISGGGSTLGEEMALNGRVNLGASTFFPPEKPTAAQRGLVRVPIGVDGLAIIVQASNVITGLTTDQLRGLFDGSILDWADAGGEAGDVLLVSREDGSGSRTLFEDKVMQGDPVSLTAVVMPSSQDVVDYVAKTPNAIGYVSRAYVMADERYPAVTPTAVSITSTGLISGVISGVTTSASENSSANVRVLTLDGKLPTLDSLRDRTYTLIQPLYLISRGQPWGNMRQFIDFVLSPAGQTIVRRYDLPVR